MAVTVSVIVPAHNAEKCVAACLTALTNQSKPGCSFDIIVVDDGSEDGTEEIVRQFPVTYVRQTKSGPATARNTGVRESSGEIILFTDSDCVPAPDWIREMKSSFDNPIVAAAKGAYRTQQTSLTARFAQVEFEERYEKLKKSASIDLVDTYSAGFRRHVFVESGGFDTSFPKANNEDVDLSYRIAEKGHRMVFNPHAIVHHLGHPNSPLQYARLKFWRGFWRTVVYKRFPRKAMADSYTPQGLKFQILFFYVGCLSLVLMPVLQPAMVVFVASVAMFGLLAVPFGLFAAGRDATVAGLAPFFLALRAAAIGAGVIWVILTRFSLPDPVRETVHKETSRGPDATNQYLDIRGERNQ